MPRRTQTTSSSPLITIALATQETKQSHQKTVSLLITLFFWGVGLAFAVLQAWSFRFTTTADGIAYLDMSDVMFRGFSWDHVINGVWSPLYAVALGIGRHMTPVAGEIQNAHYINIGIFLFAFSCFEVLRRTIKACTPGMNAMSWRSTWTFDVIGYALFLWASIGAITLQVIRPDMLMSGFLYLAASLAISIRASDHGWSKYILLGAVLGVGYLVKAPMLYIGLVLLACVLDTRRLRETSVKAAAAAGILLAIGSLYFMPLSAKLGHFTFGQSSEYNYLYHVDQIGMYSETLGHAGGKFENAPAQVIDHPPVYEFATGERVTFPLRFQPDRWTVGAKPRFYLPTQLAIIKENAAIYRALLLGLTGVIAGVLLFGFRSPAGFDSILTNWPLVLVGIAGIGMYLLVHVEERYVGAFFLLLCLGLISGACATARIPERIHATLGLTIALSLLIQVAAGVRQDYRRYRQQPTNAWLRAANELSAHGIQAGDKVARICTRFADLNWARELRATIVSEVQFDRTVEFWSAPPDVQDRVLRAMANSGARIVVANRRDGKIAPENWHKVGGTTYYYRELAGFRSR